MLQLLPENKKMNHLDPQVQISFPNLVSKHIFSRTESNNKMYLVKQLLAMQVLTSLAILLEGMVKPLSISMLWKLDILKT